MVATASAPQSVATKNAQSVAAASAIRRGTTRLSGMSVAANRSSRPLSHEGVTYYFCSAGCRQAFEADPAAHVKKETRC